MASDLQQHLLDVYGQYMQLTLFVDSEDTTLRDKYIAAANDHHIKMVNQLHHLDAGFDLYAPRDLCLVPNVVNKIDYEVIGCAHMVKPNGVSWNSSFYMYPRSSISKTRLRLANNVGIIDAGYRGHLIGAFDVVNPDGNTGVSRFERHLQICAPGLAPIVVRVVETRNDLGERTARGDGGFGSTGV